MRDVIIVGSGASGVSAALALVDRGIRPMILDVGYDIGQNNHPVRENFYEHRKRRDCFDLMVGRGYQGLAKILHGRQMPVKLMAPFVEYVTRDAEIIAPIDGTDFSAVRGFSRGGLANAWGAGLYRFTAEDLTQFPISQADLDPYFDRLTDEIGIAGEQDDLTAFFGSTSGLLQPLKLSRNMSQVYRRYLRIRKLGGDVHIGRARIAVLRSARGDRPSFQYHALEFFQEDASIYSPRYTLDKLIDRGEVEYCSGLVVDSWSEIENTVRVRARELNSSANREFVCRRLLLAAGAINTTKIVLASHRDYRTELPLVDNPALQIPLILPFNLGKSLDTEAFGLCQLNLIWDSPEFGMRLQGSLMEITAPARSEFVAEFPFAARDNFALTRQMLPAMIVMQLFFPSEAQPPAQISLMQNGALRIDGHANKIDLNKLRALLRFLRRIGCVTLPRLIVRVPTGHGVHYGASLPMKDRPERYECDPNGKLHGTRGVYIADSAAFTMIPAKNMSFAMMANSMRVASIAAQELDTA